MNTNSPISKTAFLKFEQCAKAFFFYKRFYHLRDKPTREKELIFSRGHNVGKTAQQLFPGGIDVSLEVKGGREALELTQKLIENKTPVIYEATFMHNGVLVMVDILIRNDDHYTAFEVKSSLKITDTYIKDACLQYYVVKNALPALDDFFLVNLNGDYELEEELNVKKLFRKRSIKENAVKNFEFFDHRAEQMHLTLERNLVPGIPIGKHCFSPYECEFLSQCWKNTESPKSIFNIGKIGKEQLFEWYHSGMDTVDKVVLDDAQKPHVHLQVKSMRDEKEFIDLVKVREFINSVKGTFCFMDMEIWSPAIPVYNGTRPFEQIPFLYSVCHSENGIPVFKNYLKPIEEDGREEFLIRILRDTENFDTVIVYDKNLEVIVLNALKKLFPNYSSAINDLLKKMVDIADLVLNFYYYHPSFKGKFSLKSVSEILSTYTSKPEFSSGIVAMYAYESLLSENNPIVAETIKQQLIEYCGSDTEISLKFFDFLKEKITE